MAALDRLIPCPVWVLTHATPVVALRQRNGPTVRESPYGNTFGLT